MDVYEVVKPFYVLSRFVGFSWFALPAHHHFYQCPWSKFADALLMGVHVSLRLYNVYWAVANSVFSLQSSPSLLFTQLFLIVNPIAWLFFIILGIFKRGENATILKDIAQFDHLLVTPIDHRRHKRIVIGYTFFLFLGIPAVSTFIYLTYGVGVYAPIKVVINSTLSIMLYGISISHILLATWSVLVRLRLMNESFRRDCQMNAIVVGVRLVPPLNIQHYRILFECLFSIVEKVNVCYAWIGFTCIGICFLGLMSTLFFTYDMLTMYEFSMNGFLANSFWLVVFNAFVVAIVNINDKLKQQVMGTEGIINYGLKLINSRVLK